jgi:hypothetical protein
VTPDDSDSADGTAPGVRGDADVAAPTASDDGDGDGPAATEGPDGDVDDSPDSGGGAGGREVVVPMRLYKTVTVVATLLAMVGVVVGFVFLDAATGQGSADGIEEIDPVTALLGLGFIVGGAATYAFSTRFRAEGMGRSKTDEDESSGNG